MGEVAKITERVDKFHYKLDDIKFVSIDFDTRNELNHLMYLLCFAGCLRMRARTLLYVIL